MQASLGLGFASRPRQTSFFFNFSAFFASFFPQFLSLWMDFNFYD